MQTKSIYTNEYRPCFDTGSLRVRDVLVTVIAAISVLV